MRIAFGVFDVKVNVKTVAVGEGDGSAAPDALVVAASAVRDIALLEVKFGVHCGWNGGCCRQRWGKKERNDTPCNSNTAGQIRKHDG